VAPVVIVSELDEAGMDPRLTNIEVLRNEHGSLKWFWQLIMGFALVTAIVSAYNSLFPTDSRFPITAMTAVQHRTYSALILFPIIFIPMFLRFYFGDVRYLDERYIEHQLWQPVNGYLDDLHNKLPRSRFWLDVLLLFMHGVSFIVMALAISSYPRFFGAWLALLIMNTVYLAVSARLDRDPAAAGKPRPRGLQLLRVTRYHRWLPCRWASAASYWWRNNLLAIVLAAPLLTFSYMGRHWSGTLWTVLLVIIAAANSVIDFLLTSEFYYPTLGRDLDRYMRRQRS